MLASIDLSLIFPIYVSLMGLIVWFVAFNVIGVVQVMSDKRKARRRQRRIPEKRLMWLGALGGALMMWITMLFIHHKTRHNKFMIGFPLMVCLHVFLVAFIWMNGDLFYINWGISL